jgi:transposase
MMSGIAYETKRLDHLGIVAGICREIGLAEVIDQRVGPSERQVSVGQATQAMVLNGLGFSSRALYLTPEFFANKPVDLLVGEGITAEMLNDDTLGRALDALYEAGVTELFAAVALSGCRRYGLQQRYKHLDSTSFHLHGAYDTAEPEREAVHITYGHSKEERPDLKQVVVNLITSYRCAIPLWLEVLSGNSNDKRSFIATIDAYSGQMVEADDSFWVVDSALYSAENLRALGERKWLSRVPQTIGLAQEWIAALAPEEMRPLDAPGYRGKLVEVTYGDVPQRWLVVYSQTADEREAKSFARQLARQREQAEKQLRRLLQQTFACEADAREALAKASRRWRYHQARATIEAITGYAQPGRPPKGAEPQVLGYRLVGEVVEDEAVLAAAVRRRGKFIIATNELDSEQMPPAAMLAVYKAQGVSVERGFRFLKDPMFFADSLFLKKPERIMALIMVMGLALLVYALGERYLRQALAAEKETIPNQVGKPTRRPTLRRVFQMFEGIDLLLMVADGQIIDRRVLNLTPVRLKIIALLGPAVKMCYLCDV